MTPEAATLHLNTVLGGDIFKLRAGLSTYNEELQAKLLAVDVAQQKGLAALHVIAANAGTEMSAIRRINEDVRGLTNDANAKVAAKFIEMDTAL